MSALISNLQSECLSSLLIMIVLAIFFIYVGGKIKKADPTKKPQGIVLVVETGVKMLYDYIKSIMPRKFEKNYYPYFALLFIYLIVSNLSGLLGLEAPTSNYSITLTMALITWTLIQFNAIKTMGPWTYAKEKYLWPPTNALGTISPLISISMRIFGNLVAGSAIMALVYQFTSFLSYKLIPFNWLGPIAAPVLHAYFDVFSGFIQALVFVTLSAILVSIENPD